MAVIAWTVLGLASGLLARSLLPGRAKGSIITCVTGIGGAAERGKRKIINAKGKPLAAGSPGLPAASPAPPPANGT